MKRVGNEKSPMRILWASEQPIRPTGYGTVSREIIKRLVKKGHEVFVMGWDYNGEDWKHEEGWTLVHTGMSGFGRELALGDTTILEVNLMRIKPDVYISLIDPWFTGHAVRSTNKMGIPFVSYMPVDGFPISYAWKDIMKMTHTPLWMSHFGKKTFEDFVDSFSSSGSAPKELLDPILDRYHKETTDVLYHGVDTKIFTPISQSEKEKAKRDLQIDHFEFMFCSVGRNTNRKQIPRLLEAFQDFLSHLPTKERKRVGLALHCGDPSDTAGMGGWDLPQMVRQMGLHRNVVFTDNGNNPLHGLSREEMALVYGMCDVHILATGGEGFGIPSVEAMSCGLPVILPDNSTGPELVGHSPIISKTGDFDRFMRGNRGWIVQNATNITGPKWGVKMGLVSVEGLTNAMLDAYQNPDLVSELGDQARAWCVEKLDWDIIADQTENILKEAMKRPHPLGENARRL